MNGVIKFEMEGCCDECCDIVHNHFDCPVCKQEFASTDIYCAIWEHFTATCNWFECEECGARFTLIGNPRNYSTWFNEIEFEWETQ